MYENKKIKSSFMVAHHLAREDLKAMSSDENSLLSCNPISISMRKLCRYEVPSYVGKLLVSSPIHLTNLIIAQHLEKFSY